MKRFSRIIVLALALTQAACSQAGSDAPNAQATTSTASPVVVKPATGNLPTTQTPSMAAARKFATGFETGDVTSPRHVVVFFDPQCPHCGMFWGEAKKLAKDAHFTWVPVSILNRTSMVQGAAILSSATPVATMDEHESKLLARAGGITAGPASPQMKAAIERNTQVLESFGARGVPFIMGINEKTGALFAESRGMPADQLVKALDWAGVEIAK